MDFSSWAALIATAAFGTAVAAGTALAPWLVPHLDKFDVTQWRSPASELANSALTIRPSILEVFHNLPNLYGGTRAEDGASTIFSGSTARR